MVFDVQAVMQNAHVRKTTNRAIPPAVFQKMVKEEFFLPWESKALDGLEIPGLTFG
jgi:hypothetical protein